MTWFKNLRVKSKLLNSFIIVIVFVVVLVVLAYTTVNSLDRNYTYVLEYPELRLQYLSELDANLIDMRRATSTLSLFAENSDSIETYWKQYEQAYSEALACIDKYIENNNADTVREAAILKTNTEIVQDMKKQLESYSDIANRALAVARETLDPGATGAIFVTGAPIINGIQDTSTELVDKAKSYVDQVSDENTKSQESSILIFIIISVVIVILSIIIALYVSGLISNPLLKMSATMDQVGNTGSLVFTAEIKAELEKIMRGKDEIAQTVSSTIKAVQHFEKISGILQQVADGDLTAEFELLSDNDTMGASLQKMADNLNSMFGEIRSSTAQVSTGSKQIADGSQSLAQGSTEQAAAVEQLSSSISEIAHKTKSNAEMAGRAASLASAIMQNAQKGSHQMDEMMAAVREINAASQSISKVIKVIDDIAFQTNILALNAAVEAARAGQHGKGFAVVAEEVRNLAAKSAEAAKETGDMIANSIEKAELGVRIAGDTSASLTEIVSGINESNRLVGDIARSSEEQSLGISQINTGIDQVAQVVQQNSATAEESAAASEEMSGQSEMLEQLISQFKLKDSQTHSMFASSQTKARLAMPAKSSYIHDQTDGFDKY